MHGLEEMEWTSTTENDINIPPPYNSPKNIANILDDDCLQAIFRKIDDVKDLFSAAQVCTWFQANAKVSFPRGVNVLFGYQNTDVSVSRLDHKYNITSNKLFLDSIDIDVKSFLNLFGPRIETILLLLEKLPQNIGQTVHDDNLNLIWKYCGNTLKNLHIRGQNDYVCKLRTPLKALEVFRIYEATVDILDATIIFPELKTLMVYRDIVENSNWFTIKFPKLECIQLFFINLQDETFIKFQNLNPQLNGLLTSNCEGLTSTAWEDIGARLPNIVNLELNFMNSLEECAVHLSRLKCLKKISLHAHSNSSLNYIKSFLSLLIQNKHPIELLAVRDVDIELGRILKRFKTVKSLMVTGLITDHDMLNIVRSLPLLEEFKVMHTPATVRTSLWTVGKILEHCRNLKKIYIWNVNEIELNQFNSIVAMATGRTYVNLRVHIRNDTEENIFHNIQKIKNKWVSVRGFK